MVNISTSQTLPAERNIQMPKAPDGSPLQEFFDEFFKKQQGLGGGQPRKVQSLGSGFVIDASGLVVTNNHVIEGADEVTVILTDNTRLKAEVVGRDKKTDVALLRVKPAKPLKFVEFGDSDQARVGDWVMAIGNPLGLGGSVTIGIVSARNRDIHAGPYDNFIQTDAAINKGNSGGPLFDMDGRVIGINTAIASPNGGSIGIGFALPSKTAIAVVDQLKQFGETRRGWLGVRIQAVTDDIAESLGLKEAKGALVAGISEGGPSAKAGIQAGDVIIRFDGKDVPNVRELPRMVADTAIDKKVPVTVLRKGKEVTVDVQLGRLEEGEKKEADKTGKGGSTVAPTAKSVAGMTLGALDAEARAKFKIKDQVAKGVVVAAVDPGSVAAEKKIEPGNVIPRSGAGGGRLRRRRRQEDRGGQEGRPQARAAAGPVGRRRDALRDDRRQLRRPEIRDLRAASERSGAVRRFSRRRGGSASPRRGRHRPPRGGSAANRAPRRRGGRGSSRGRCRRSGPPAEPSACRRGRARSRRRAGWSAA